MKAEQLLAVTRIADDSTGMYAVGELDFAISGRLEMYLEQDCANRDKILSMLGFISHLVCEKAEKVAKMQDQAQGQDQKQVSAKEVKPSPPPGPLPPNVIREDDVAPRTPE